MNDPAAPGHEPDDRLVARAVDGDERALDQLVRRHYETAWRVAVGILRDEDAASDVVQEAFVKMVKAIPNFRGDAKFRTWLLTIVANEAKGAIRKNTRRRESALDDVGPLAHDGAGADEDVLLRSEGGRIREQLAKLPEKQRLAVELRIDEGLSFREVGEVIGSSEGAARVNYHHGVKKLREWFRVEAT